MDEYSYFLNMFLKRDSGLDCSEMIENFRNKFGGTSLLILAKDYSKGGKFCVTDYYCENHEYAYHYAWINSKGEIVDPMLGYFEIEREKYLDSININSKSVIEISDVSSLNLKAYI